jgi:hypothetical protein
MADFEQILRNKTKNWLSDELIKFIVSEAEKYYDHVTPTEIQPNIEEFIDSIPVNEVIYISELRRRFCIQYYGMEPVSFSKHLFKALRKKGVDFKKGVKQQGRYLIIQIFDKFKFNEYVRHQMLPGLIPIQTRFNRYKVFDKTNKLTLNDFTNELQKAFKQAEKPFKLINGMLQA